MQVTYSTLSLHKWHIQHLQNGTLNIQYKLNGVAKQNAMQHYAMFKKKTDTTDNVSANSTAVKVRTTVDKYADQEWTFHAEK